MAGRGVTGSVYYSDTSILESHGSGDVVSGVVCSTP